MLGPIVTQIRAAEGPQKQPGPAEQPRPASFLLGRPSRRAVGGDRARLPRSPQGSGDRGSATRKPLAAASAPALLNTEGA